MTVCGFGSVDEETGTLSLQYASAGSWGLSDDMEWYLTFVLGPQNSFPLSLTTKHFLEDLWIVTSEEEECRWQRKKQHKKKKMGWAVPGLSNRKLNSKVSALHILGP